MNTMDHVEVSSPQRHGALLQDRLNRRVYHSAEVPRHYASHASLMRPEVMALLKHQSAFVGRDVLDLGVGTGRTSLYLAPLARRYVGLDYSPAMVAHMRTHLPDLDVGLGDMRDLSAFEPGSFDFVLASCNVIDAVSHDDRLRVLAEVRRVLHAGGLFVFSSHNRRFRAALEGPRIERSRNPTTQALNVVRYVRRLVNHARVAPLRRLEAEYALLDDRGHDYALLHYYIDRFHQERQLEQAGFRLLDTFDAFGTALDDEDDGESSSLLYVARREPEARGRAFAP